jgi:hypothetical protein
MLTSDRGLNMRRCEAHSASLCVFFRIRGAAVSVLTTNGGRFVAMRARLDAVASDGTGNATALGMNTRRHTSLGLFAFSAALLAVATSASLGGCALDGVSELPIDSELQNDGASLSTSDRNELAAAGFSASEVKAVVDSISVSKVLGVQSFVQESNDGTLRSDAALRRESHGKAQGCLRAKVEVTAKEGAGVFKSGTCQRT